MGKLKVKTNQFVDANKILFYCVTVCWCVTCKSNNIMDFDSIKTLHLFQRKNFIAMQGGFIYQYDEIYRFLTYYYRVLIPFCNMFCLFLH